MHTHNSGPLANEESTPSEGETRANILVVEDNETNQLILQGILETAGYEAWLCDTGQEALDLIATHHVDLVLLDIVLPGIDGYEICRRLKIDARTKPIPVIFLTAKTRPEDIVRGLEVGAVDYVAKPFHAAELLARIRTHIALKQAREEITELRKLVPICAWCRKIRQPDDTWQSIEQYLIERTDSQITHGICPDCRSKL